MGRTVCVVSLAYFECFNFGESVCVCVCVCVGGGGGGGGIVGRNQACQNGWKYIWKGFRDLKF